jgi:transcriptional regulator with XRE-family HTH domain
MTTTKPRVTNRVRTVRIAAGMSQSRLARLAEMDQTALSRIECGRVTPDLATLQRLAKAMSRHLVDLLEAP